MKKFIINIVVNETLESLKNQLAIAQAALEEANNASTSSAANTAKTKATNALSAAQELVEELDPTIYGTVTENILEEIETCISGCTTRYNKLVDDEFVATMNAIKVGTQFTGTTTGPTNTSTSGGTYYDSATVDAKYTVCYNPSTSRTIWLTNYGKILTSSGAPTMHDFGNNLPTYKVVFSNIGGKSFTINNVKQITYSDSQTCGIKNAASYIEKSPIWINTVHHTSDNSSYYYIFKWESSTSDPTYGNLHYNLHADYKIIVKINY